MPNTTVMTHKVISDRWGLMPGPEINMADPYGRSVARPGGSDINITSRPASNFAHPFVELLQVGAHRVFANTQVRQLSVRQGVIQTLALKDEQGDFGGTAPRGPASFLDVLDLR